MSLDFASKINIGQVLCFLWMDRQLLKFSQLFIYVTENEVSNRMNYFLSPKKHFEIDKDVVHDLIKMFDGTNIIIKAFRIEKVRFAYSNFVQVRLRLLGERYDKKYSEVSCSEIVRLIMWDVDELVNQHDIIVEHNLYGL